MFFPLDVHVYTKVPNTIDTRQFKLKFSVISTPSTTAD